MEQFKNEWHFSLHALRCLSKNKKIIFITLAAKLISLLVIVWIAHPLLLLILHHAPITKINLTTSYSHFFSSISFYIKLLLLLYLNNIIGTLLYAWNEAIVFYHQTSPNLSAWKILKQHIHRCPELAKWCLIRSFVGGPTHWLIFILKFYRWFDKKLISGSWHLTSYFSVLCIFIGKSSAIHALENSRKLLRATWGDEHLVVRIARPLRNTAFVLILVFLIAPAWIIQYLPVSHWGITAGAITIVLLYVLFTIETALSNVYGAVLYAYASEKKVIAPFTETELQSAFLPRYD